MSETLNSENKLSYANGVTEILETYTKHLSDNMSRFGALANHAQFKVVDNVFNNFVKLSEAYNTLSKTTTAACVGIVEPLAKNPFRGGEFAAHAKAVLNAVEAASVDAKPITKTRDGHEVWGANEKVELKSILESINKERYTLICDMKDLSVRCADPNLTPVYDTIGKKCEDFTNACVTTYNSILDDLSVLDVDLSMELTEAESGASKVKVEAPAPDSILNGI